MFLEYHIAPYTERSYKLMFRSKQLSLTDVYDNCLDAFDNDKPLFFSLLDDCLDIDSLIPRSFIDSFHLREGRPREYPLQAFIRALLIQRIFSIPTDSLLLVFLRFSRELREFCGFEKVPDASKITRFKQDFVEDIKDMFDRLVDLTEPICQAIDAARASMTIFDTSGIEAYVRENNPKYADSIVKRLKAWKASVGAPESYDPYKAAYGMMPSHAEACPGVKQMYINGHFCYAYKFGIVTNGLGIVRHIDFYDEKFIATHPEIEVGKKSGSPDEDKSLADSKALIPTLEGFFGAHPDIKPDVFVGDAAFDSVDIYNRLMGKDGLGFKKAFIPLNARSAPTYPDCPLNANGVPCCPNDPQLPMKQEGNTSHLRCGLPSLKFVCPKMSWVRCEDGEYRRRTSCESPCTDSPCGRMFYIYPEKGLRAFPGVVRGTEEWDGVYKARIAVEKTINHFKDSFCVAGRRSQNALTARADLLLAGIAQQITVLLAHSIRRHEYIRSLKPLIAA
jgi:hypothetical protein